ncbi:exo 1,3/1,4-beta-D-glucan glucohydrolase [Reinekea forsetii]|nr:exo 1,3/1,4-beta-D-glucan glucohydrolase [Reinekea forsetii]
MSSKPILALASSLLVLSACKVPEEVTYRNDYTDWPAIESSVQLDEEVEAQISTLLANMSLAEKIGQMVQPEINSATPQDVIDYHLGSVLNGGGSWPENNKAATAADWVALADAYWEASMDASDGRESIPIIWGTDAVHGHSNVFGAVIFPHNIGLGAANDKHLLQKIGSATAKQVTVTGLDWTFAPTLAVVRDDRWGRTYEGYSEDPEIVFDYGRAMVKGLQGSFDENKVVATAKHFIGDGGTDLGDDQGDNLSTEQDMINIHGQGYFSSLNAGVQTVMASFNSWNGEKIHGDEYLLTHVLKEKMKFDGFVISDWNGQGQVEGCTNDHCAQAINAGIDMMMVPHDWKSFITNTMADVDAGLISMERIDDAVTRILRVKFRAGLFEKPKPSARLDAGNDSKLATPKMRALARKAVQKSLVLLKNNDATLPLSKDANILVVGASADSMQNQTGGWTLTWQGTGNSNLDFPNGDTILDGFVAEVAEGVGSITYSETGSVTNGDFDVIVAVIGETPYAEGNGDISKFETLSFAKQNPSASNLLNNVATNNPNTPIVTVYVGGRPLWMNKELNVSDAFVSAWLPGSEGKGVADVLFGDKPFTGKLSYSWPAEDCQVPINAGDEQTPLFALGYGLTTTDTVTVDWLDETESDIGCDAPDIIDAGTTNQPLDLFTSGSAQGDFALRIGGQSNWGGVDVSVDPLASTDTTPDDPAVTDINVTTVDGAVQYSAKKAQWIGNGQIYVQTTNAAEGQNLAAYANSETSISFRVKVNSAPQSGTVNLSVHCVYPCLGEVNIAPMLSALPTGQWTDISIPLQCLSGLDITNVNTPFLIWADDAGMDLSLENIRWMPFTAGSNPDCSSFEPDAAPSLTTQTDVYVNGLSNTDMFNAPSVWSAKSATDWSGIANYVTVADVDQGGDLVMDIQYGYHDPADGPKATVAIPFATPHNLTALSKLQFDIKVLDYAGATEVWGKMVSPGNLSTGDIVLNTALNTWVTNEIVFADYAQNEIDFGNVGTVLEVLPSWVEDHNNVHFQLDNIRILP